MYESVDANAYLERAEMHEQLASATADEPARKMHQAMAAEYRRKAAACGMNISSSAPVMRSEMSVPAYN